MGLTDTDRISKLGVSRYYNRELSWLDFACRVLELIEDESVPLLERVKFISIFGNGLDEFFQVRIAALKDQLAANLGVLSADGMTPREQLKAIRRKLVGMLDRLDAAYEKIVNGELRCKGVQLVEWNDLELLEQELASLHFSKEIFPVLTPLAVDPSHPFPYISNLSLNLAVVVRDTEVDSQRIARVKIPPLLPRLVEVADGRFITLEDVIAAHLEMLFPEMEVGEHYVFRVTRNADLTLEEEEADDLLALVELELRRRRFGRAVRLEIVANANPDVVELLVRELELHPDDVYYGSAMMDLGGLWSIYAIDMPELKGIRAPLVTPPGLLPEGLPRPEMFGALREHDFLLHHPYETFSGTVEMFVDQAANDPDVLAIKQTLYRTSGDSAIIESLIRAADSNKQVAVLVELKARFDEQANIGWARKLEQAGVHVVYGLVGLKTHMKAILVVRREADGLKRYCHIGTGNYNAKTARSYEDMGLLSGDQELCSDLSEVFNLLTGFSKKQSYQRLILAPSELRTRITELIREQASLGEAGRVIIKVNGLVDPDIIDELYAASMAGVKIDLLVRGICSLRPQLPGLSENITVRSIVGQYLEHSRVYCFGGGPGAGRTVFIGSADLMPRNLDRRVELLVPLVDPAVEARVVEALSLDLADDVQTWELGSDSVWKRVPNINGFCAQERLGELAIERSKSLVGRQ